MKITSLFSIILLAALMLSSCSSKISIVCSEDNDLYLTLKENKVKFGHFTSPLEALKKACDGSGILILADGYPGSLTAVDSSLYKEAQSRNIRLYVEYPSFIPGRATGPARRTTLERVIVTTDTFRDLNMMQILTLHNCHHIPVKDEAPLLSVAKVSGFDRAVYGLENTESYAILFKDGENILASTTKLSQFKTGRYAPKKAIQSIWAYIINWASGGQMDVIIEWTPDVRPSYSPNENLPADAARIAVQRGIDWHTQAKMLLSEQGWEEYKLLWNLNDSNILTNVPAINNSAPQQKGPVGDGTYGVLEGIVSEIRPDGSQPVRWWLRSDSNGESSLAFALRWKMDGDTRSRTIAENLLDWNYFKSGLFQNDSLKPNYGLLFWAPGNAQALYQDNDIKSILGAIGTSGVLSTSKWDRVLVKNILGNFRTTGKQGFRSWRIENPDLLRDGWKKYADRDLKLLQPHYEAWTWASYLWLYDKTKWEPLLEKTAGAIRMMMEGYPSEWRWTNGIQQERCRMLLTLAWLIRVDDRPEYRGWLKKIASDIAEDQDESGAIREELGPLEKGDMAPPKSNEEYGHGEAPLIQQNGDSVADLLYTCNFAFLGLHEAYAATGDEQIKGMADKLAEFLIRIQVKSEKHTEVDGGWYRAFDFNQWEYWGSNADAGWGAWSIETGWTQAWIPTVLSMRETGINLWDISRGSGVNKHFDSIRKHMIPDSVLSGEKSFTQQN